MLDPNQAPEPPPASRDRALWVNLAVLCGAALAVYVVFHFRPFGTAGPEDHPAVGTKAPVLEVEPLLGKGKPVARKDLQGQVVVVAFWGSWSDSCRKELPHVAALAGQYGKLPDFRVLSIACPQRPDEDLAELAGPAIALLKELKIELPAYVDPTGATIGSFRGLAKLERLPTVYLLDRGGTIRAVWSGYREGVEEEIAERVKELLAEAAGEK